MNDKIRDFVEAMFAGLPKTQDVVEAKLGIIENMQDKYDELIAQGKNDNEAFGIVISQFGSMDELKRELGIEDQADYNTSDNSKEIDSELTAEYEIFRKRYSVFGAIAVGLYILSGAFFMLFEAAFSELAGIIAFFIPIAFATAIFVFFGMKDSRYQERLGRRKPKSDVDDDDDPVVGAIYIGATVIFLLLGFIWGLWHPGWIVYLIATMIVVLYEGVLKNKKA